MRLLLTYYVIIKMNLISTPDDGACALKRVIIITVQANKIRDDNRIFVYHVQRKYHLYTYSSLNRIL